MKKILMKMMKKCKKKRTKMGWGYKYCPGVTNIARGVTFFATPRNGIF